MRQAALVFPEPPMTVGTAREPGESRPRKIIHVDMDAFYASVEQRDSPELRGRPVAVGGHRGVSRRLLRSAQVRRSLGVPAVTARRRCPELIFVKPRFDVYAACRRQVRGIFADYTDWSSAEPRRSLSRRYRGPARLRHRAGDCRGYPPADPRGDGAHRLGGRQLLQIHRQARLRPSQARRAVRHPARARRRVRCNTPGGTFPRRRPGHRAQDGAPRYQDRRRPRRLEPAPARGTFRQQRIMVLAHLPRHRRSRGEARPAVQIGQRGADI